ncbi:MAG: enoyl-CoA hydratase-related protein [Pseudomonadales bacterium]|jgi:2-(1,2-epoxy-1,2-dihydrophenyl)acetyl-CoA isomerase|nr:enoyl-CoA hydratase-related protein [Pseudomonadales bacterium]MDP6471855.1 enoyl-CoA hydratase-related protein [Pseudomonadales bacterium]MDP6826875.1 enoyl-CoA hydratase-related protein [Pseudomonadales bacterium]MDP6970847.1 enoyl-CoA hydratase-related protein [Pseudomonadales bacterium]|tara:strand:+ start:83 stop:913 length:831 start_codon:yes stop_codon:yes gene_type:complete
MAREPIETGSEALLAYEEDGVAVLTLNRPQARNAMGDGMTEGLAAALQYAENASQIRAIVVTGAGGAFCAGGDVKGMAAGGGGGGQGPSLDERIHAQRLNQRATAGKMFLMPKPVIASLPGPAAGAGLSLALAADLRIMADTAFITSAFAKVGFSGDYGGTFFLSQLVGSGKARELYYLSDRVSAQECLQLGIANQVVPADELESATMALARRLAEGPPVAYRYMKENFNRASMGGDVIDCLDLEATHHVHAGLTEDHRNAAKAFVEKTQPVFVGR